MTKLNVSRYSMVVKALRQRNSMGLLNTFFGKHSNSQEFGNKLHQKVTKLMPNADEKDQLHLACIAGLYARVAYVDMKIHPDEQSLMEKSLIQWGKFDQDQAQAITLMAIEHVQELSGLENHLYCIPLSENLSNEKRYGLLTSLFALAASDGGVDNNESEEIRHISKGLLLEHKHFISARATVLDKLDALKK